MRLIRGKRLSQQATFEVEGHDQLNRDGCQDPYAWTWMHPHSQSFPWSNTARARRNSYQNSSPIVPFPANVTSKGSWQRRAPSNDSICPSGTCLQPSTVGRTFRRHTVHPRADARCTYARSHAAERRGQRTEPATNSSTAVICCNRRKVAVSRHECVSARS